MANQRFLMKFRPLVPQIGTTGTLTFEFSDSHARELHSELEAFEGFEAWAESPRSFALLFMLREGAGMHALSASDFNDDLLPFPNDSALRRSRGLSESDIRNLMVYQDSFLAPLATVENLESFKAVGHRPMRNGNIHFEVNESLGSSNTARICRVTHLSSGKPFAIKLFLRKTADMKKADRNIPSAYELFRNERSNLQKLMKLNHKHLITLIGTYTDKTYFALILEPAAECDMAVLLALDSSAEMACDRDEILQKSLGCLVAGLKYLHGKKIRHRDIKPGNILIHNGSVIICDLGISHDWSDSTKDFTYGTVNGQTKRYSAPEVLEEGPRDLKADIWSLGCVFLEIVTVLKRCTLDDLRRFFRPDPLGRGDYCEHPELIQGWIEELGSSNVSNEPLLWIKEMLTVASSDRPSAEKLLNDIQEQFFLAESEVNTFIGRCCLNRMRLSEPRRVELRGPQQRQGLREPRQPLFSPGWNFAPVPQPAGRSSYRTPIGDAQRSASQQDITVSPEYPVGPTNESSCSLSDEQSDPHRPSESTDAPRSRQHSSVTSRSNCEKYFGYTSQISQAVEFSGTKKFSAKISSFQVLSSREVGRWEDPISAAGNFVDISESDDEALWQRYRLLEIKASDGSPRESAWLPLHKLRVKLQDEDGVGLELEWSDCNHLFKEPAGNHSFLLYRVFDPSQPNNRLRLQFLDRKDAEDVRQILLNHDLCHHEEGSSEERCFKADAKTGEHRYYPSSVYICRPSNQTPHRTERMIRKERLIRGFSTSDIYVVPQNHDIVLRVDVEQLTAVVNLEQLQAPDYHSDVRDLPYANDAEGRFFQVVCSGARLALRFKLDDGDVTRPPTDLKEFLHGMFGWELVFLAPVTAKKLPKWRRHDTDEAILLLFNTNVAAEGLKSRAKLVLLFHKARGDRPKWLIGEPMKNNVWKKDEVDMKIRYISTAANLGELLSERMDQETSSYKLGFEMDESLHSLYKHINELQKSPQQMERSQQSRHGSEAGSVARQPS
ncbi:serine threonine protein kinase [Diplodia corticola]|uniref:Serine threonine protein kinase n=1 Tax=Diplodia corticola TaxID=236234 RepID=A0A1J9RBV8_9PEZI|nr:serine threonine protein kinase [Diplodia corticola]OJD39078.1 serine threonine protein kinase [Diplodia corticola]